MTNNNSGTDSSSSVDSVEQPVENKSLINEHKGKLAIGVAATLGVMVFYNWRERQLAKKDPEGHARLQRLKAIVRTDEIKAKPGEHKNDVATQPDKESDK
ncbi:MAG: hypothetical protein JWQ23_4107 [Herminiimonas sp.]|nr:hypothetical protein [Herminiimonas sp.]